MEPRIKGSRAPAEALLAGCSVLRVGDSITSGNADTLYRYLTATPIRGFDVRSPMSFTQLNASIATNQAVTEFTDTMNVCTAYCQQFTGNVSGAINDWASNRLCSLNFGPQSVFGVCDSPATQTALFGFNWMASVLAAGRPLTVRLLVYKHPGGPQNADVWFQLRSGTTILATSDYFNGYAAAAGWHWVTAQIPTSAAWAGSLSFELRFRGNTQTEAGKRLVFSSRVECVDTATAGFVHHNVTVATSAIDWWIDPARISEPVYAFMRMLAPDVVVISHGQNNPSNNTPAQHATKLAAFMTALNAPAAKVILVPTHGTAGLPGGGESGEAYHVTGAGLAIDANPAWCLLNLHRQLPRYAAIDAGYRGDWQQNAAGTQFYANQVVRDTTNNNNYAAKQDHTKGATAPSADATNWALVNAVVGSNSRPNASWHNPLVGDGTHPTPGGHELLAASLVAMSNEAVRTGSGLRRIGLMGVG